METTTMIKVASPRNCGGKFWDDEGRAEIAAIFVSYDSEFKSIQFLYVDNGNYVFSDQHGDKMGLNFDTVARIGHVTTNELMPYQVMVLGDPKHPKESLASIYDHLTKITLNYPSEFLTSISGFSRNYATWYKLTSITFGTNQGTYGPFGIAEPTLTKFDFQLGQHRYFGGFHGTLYNGILESIGVYIKPPTNVPTDANAGTTKVKKEKY